MRILHIPPLHSSSDNSAQRRKLNSHLGAVQFGDDLGVGWFAIATIFGGLPW
jgi:hypothetical protein